MTRTHFLSLYDQLFSPKTAGHSIFGPPCDIIGGIISTDPSHVNRLCSPNRETAILFQNGILLCV